MLNTHFSPYHQFIRFKIKANSHASVIFGVQCKYAIVCKANTKYLNFLGESKLDLNMRPSIILTFCVSICFDFGMTKKGYQGKDCLLIICTFDSTDVSISYFFQMFYCTQLVRALMIE